jgi:hypothetical protein
MCLQDEEGAFVLAKTMCVIPLAKTMCVIPLVDSVLDSKTTSIFHKNKIDVMEEYNKNSQF